MSVCGICAGETRDADPTLCHECEQPTCEGDRCGFWCSECTEWTCSDQIV
jgi:hypothetical protein